MITVGESVVLGVVQGLTEFLPVSSSGHLAVMHRFLTPLSAEETLAVDVALHIGTLVAVVAYFWRDLWGMAQALAAPRHAGWRWTWIWLLGLATLPAAALGLPFKHLIAESFLSMVTVGTCFLATGTLLFLAGAVRGARRTEADVTVADAFTIGCFQAVALLPGVSRSGSTIAAALFRRIRSDVAARFSFLLGIPAVVGAEFGEAKILFALGPSARLPLGIGIVVSGLTGLVAIWALMRIVQEGRLHLFAYYLWTLGGLVLAGATFFGF